MIDTRKRIKPLNNEGSTMVEVLVGFVLLMVLMASMIGIINLSSDLMMKSKDMLDAQENMQAELYKTNHGSLQLNALPRDMFSPAFGLKETDANGNAKEGGITIELKDMTFYKLEEKEDTENKTGLKVYILDKISNYPSN